MLNKSPKKLARQYVSQPNNVRMLECKNVYIITFHENLFLHSWA